MITSRKKVFIVLVALYFAQGLPFGFFIQALPVVLRTRGYSLEVVGLSGLLALPWALKFLWAPWVDRVSTRARWIFAMQASMTALLVVLAALGAGEPPLWAILVGVLLTNLFAATQDIATDGLAVCLLPPEDRGLANGVQVAAYRLGMILGGGALLAAFELLGWSGAFTVMAVAVAVSALPLALARPRVTTAVDAPAAVAAPHFLRRPGALRLLAALVVFKAGDAAANAMVRPWLVDQGASLGRIGELLGTVGFTAGLFGALAGGWLVTRASRARVLVGFAALQALAVLGYGLLAASPQALGGAVSGVLAFEHFAGGLATAALFTTMMDHCRAEVASTDYTVQASAVVIATGAAASLAGFAAAQLGYVAHFFVCAGLAGLSMAVVPWLLRPLGRPKKETSMRALYAGTFDPVTAGHLAVIDAARASFDEVIVLLAENPAKAPLFSLEERRAQLEAALDGRDRVRVDATDGLVAAYARDHEVRVLVRGLRSGAEAGYELDLARANRTLAPELNTVILPAPAELEAVSSTLLKQMAAAGLDGRRWCSPEVWQALQSRLSPPRRAS